MCTYKCDTYSCLHSGGAIVSKRCELNADGKLKDVKSCPNAEPLQGGHPYTQKCSDCREKDLGK
jgi:hypothetical protein